MSNSTLAVLLAGALAMLLLADCVTSQVCPQCKCPTTFKPVCASKKSGDTVAYRGFANRCVLDCFNACRRYPFTYLGEGRCSKFKTSTSAPLPYAMKDNSLKED